ncbi:hypothetical protein J7337_001054 [Fusarium musae]|uniref:Uncharacterized protein n=1 Tax=Fusarium musae TaxID=1042133 RepID=A0A9P8IW22_9HYPO|nr:hypothetical protein J7337_001054 [Fusarium musae]KAG9507502.1 hypothetical protein J7337_001054 [Fusarium musae]
MAALNIRYSHPSPNQGWNCFCSRLTAHGSRSITRAGVKMFPAEEINTPAPIPDRYKSAIRVGDVNEPFKIPKSLQGLVKATRKKFPTIDLGQGTNVGKKRKEVEQQGPLENESGDE